MTYPDELQQYEDRIARRNRVLNRIIILCFVLIVLTLLAFITAIGWYVNARQKALPARKVGYTKIGFGRGVTANGDTVRVFEYATRRMYDSR